ncbi:hypothetical protein PSTT_04812 [Puccinia striiformis]|uniref:Uncharacterized protein n=1 Tax=Puccinia striiformis TaxID=27350 RepID=A0A2S4VR43_9BASI|nr:hypothetical protein PSTT_04812 [Puccinia striiformis]
MVYPAPPAKQLLTPALGRSRVEMNSYGGCWRWVFFFAFLSTRGLTIHSTLNDARLLFTLTGAESKALEPSLRQPTVRPSLPIESVSGLVSNAHPLSQAYCHPAQTAPITQPDETTGVRNAKDTLKSEITARKTNSEEEDEDAGVLDGFTQCQLLGQSSARPLRTGTDNKLHKRSLKSRQNCQGKHWRKLRKRIYKAYNKARRRVIIWFLKLMIWFESKPAKRAMLKVKFAKFLRVNCKLPLIVLLLFEGPVKIGLFGSSRVNTELRHHITLIEFLSSPSAAFSRSSGFFDSTRRDSSGCIRLNVVFFTSLSTKNQSF